MLRQTWRSNIGNGEIRILSIRNSSPNVHSYTRRINGLIRLKRDNVSLYGELEMRNRLFRENHAKDFQEIEELRRNCCEETDRARDAGIDELSMHKEVNRTKKTASSIGATHVPSQPSAIPSPKTMPCCDSGLPHDTLDTVSILGNVFERPSAREGKTSTLFNNSKNWACSSLKLGSCDGRKYKETGD